MTDIIAIQKRLTAALLAASALISAPAIAGSAAGIAQTVVVEQTSLAKTADLDFGKIIVNGTGTGRVTIHAKTGARTANGNVTLIGTSGFGRATFLVTGSPKADVNFTVNNSTVSLTGPGAPLLLDNLRINRNNAGQRALPQNYKIPNSGSMIIGMGGRLRMASNQTPGVYTGTFDLTMVYQ